MTLKQLDIAFVCTTDEYVWWTHPAQFRWIDWTWFDLKCRWHFSMRCDTGRKQKETSKYTLTHAIVWQMTANLFNRCFLFYCIWSHAFDRTMWIVKERHCVVHSGIRKRRSLSFCLCRLMKKKQIHKLVQQLCNCLVNLIHSDCEWISNVHLLVRSQ